AGFSADYYHYHPQATGLLVRISNYATLLFLIPAYWYLRDGSEHLLALIKRPSSMMYQRTTVAYVAFSAIYVFLVLSDGARNHPTAAVETSSYYQPDWLIILTVVIPRLIIWYWGLQAVQNIILYR